MQDLRRMDTIHDRLARVRTRTGFSTRGFAVELEQRAGYTVSHSSVSQYEVDTTVPALYVEAVARAFDVDPEWLLTGDGLPERVAPNEAERALRSIVQVVQRIRPAPTVLESQFDSFFRLSPLFMGIITPDGYLIRVNPACERVTGYSPDTMMAVPCCDFLHPDDRDEARRILDRLLGGEGPLSLENRHRRKEGGYLWMAWEAVASDGLIYVAGRDVSDRRSLDRLVREDRDFVEGILSTADALIVVTDREGRIVRFNRKAEEITGSTSHDAGGVGFTTILVSRGQEADWAARHRQVLENGAPVTWETGVPVGEERPPRRIRWSLKGLRSGNGEVTHTVAVGLDVTELREAEQALRKSRELVSLALEYAPDGLALVDGDGVIRVLNRPFAEIFGYLQEELEGKGVDLLIPNEMQGEHRDYVQNSTHAPDEQLMAPGRRTRWIRKDGSQIEVEVRLRAVGRSGEGWVVARVTRTSGSSRWADAVGRGAD